MLKDSNFAKQLLKENNTSNISLELKARPRLLNNQENNNYFLTLIYNNYFILLILIIVFIQQILH